MVKNCTLRAAATVTVRLSEAAEACLTSELIDLLKNTNKLLFGPDSPQQYDEKRLKQNVALISELEEQAVKRKNSLIPLTSD